MSINYWSALIYSDCELPQFFFRFRLFSTPFLPPTPRDQATILLSTTHLRRSFSISNWQRTTLPEMKSSSPDCPTVFCAIRSAQYVPAQPDCLRITTYINSAVSWQTRFCTKGRGCTFLANHDEVPHPPAILVNGKFILKIIEGKTASSIGV